jgi:3-hydroxy-D-aspartate aldolase
VKVQTDFTDLEVGYDVPALPGMSTDEIQNPCLIIDLDALERNVRKMGEYTRLHNMRHRAHAKMQIALQG